MAAQRRPPRMSVQYMAQALIVSALLAQLPNYLPEHTLTQGQFAGYHE
jgi:hypothetical protein